MVLLIFLLILSTLGSAASLDYAETDPFKRALDGLVSDGYYMSLLKEELALPTIWASHTPEQAFTRTLSMLRSELNPKSPYRFLTEPATYLNDETILKKDAPLKPLCSLLTSIVTLYFVQSHTLPVARSEQSSYDSHWDELAISIRNFGETKTAGENTSPVLGALSPTGLMPCFYQDLIQKILDHTELMKQKFQVHFLFQSQSYPMPKPSTLAHGTIVLPIVCSEYHDVNNAQTILNTTLQYLLYYTHAYSTPV